ncbi:hypothetical protein BHE74_00038300, partial [Ensete ventricosum]
PFHHPHYTAVVAAAPTQAATALPVGSRPYGRLRSRWWQLHGRRTSTDWPRAGVAPAGGRRLPLQVALLPAGIAPYGHRWPPLRALPASHGWLALHGDWSWLAAPPRSVYF